MAASRVAVADAHAVLVDAGDRLDDAEQRADAERRAHEQRVAERARQVVPPPNGVARLLGDTRPDEVAAADRADGVAEDTADEVDDAGAAVAAAEEASDEAIADRDAAEADLAAFLDATVARTTAQLAHADRVAVTDPASADAIRADESTVFAPVAEVVTNQQARAAEDAAAGSGTGESPAPDAGAAVDAPPATPPAPAPAAPAPAPAPEPAPLPDPAGSASGALAGAWCADGTRIVVDAGLGLGVQYLINDAAAAGVGLCGSGFRTYQEQVELRRAHCGASDAAVYEAAPSSCSPPTARPGTSNHEDGLAVDFSCADGQPMTHASPCYQWLAANAVNYGLHNLPSEPWHWSVSGT